MNGKKILGLAAAGFAFLSLAGFSFGAEPYTGPKLNLRLASPSPLGSNMVLGYEKFVELVKEKSDGKINIKLMANAVLGSDRSTLEAAQRGTLDMASCSSPNMASFARDYMVFDLPYVTSPAYQQQLYDALDNGELGKHFEKVANRIGLTTIMFSEYGYRNFAFTSSVNGIDMMKEKKVRTTDSPIEVAVSRALGMIPSPVAWGEVYTALQQGTVDGEGNNWEHLVLAKHIEVLKGAMNSEHNYSMHLLMMNKKKYDALDPQAQAILREAAKEALAYERNLTEELKEKCEKEMLAQGMTIYRLSDEERAVLKEKTQVVWDTFKNEIDPDVLQMVLDTQK